MFYDTSFIQIVNIIWVICLENSHEYLSDNNIIHCYNIYIYKKSVLVNTASPHNLTWVNILIGVTEQCEGSVSFVAVHYNLSDFQIGVIIIMSGF